jgi:DNA-binding MarR family transcriptional regulator
MAEAGEADGGADARPIADADMELAARLRLATARLYRRLRQHSLGGLSPSQLSCLTSVEKLEPVRLGDLATREAVAPPTLTRIVAGLLEIGMVARRADPDDARAALLTTTEKGRTALQTVREERTAFLVERLHNLSDEDREHLPALVDLIERLPDL